MTSSPSPTIGPLNPGNVVSAALRLYRDNFGSYIKLSALAFLWAIVPVYGWAQYSLYHGVLSRLVFRELINEPETVDQAKRQLEPKLWSFLGLGVLVGLIFSGGFMACYIGGIIAGLAVGFGVGALLNSFLGETGAIIGTILGIVLFLAIVLIGLLWIISRFIIAEVPMAIEGRTDLTTSIGRSWTLTKQSVGRIQFVLVAANLISFPVVGLISFGPQIALLSVEFGSAAYWTLYFVGLIFSFTANILVLPFWQAVKGVLYYDLRSRREGLDLQI